MSRTFFIQVDRVPGVKHPEIEPEILSPEEIRVER